MSLINPDNFHTLLNPSWASRLQGALTAPSFTRLREFLKREYAAKKTVYPPLHEVFSAFDACSFEDTKVVILGQDPYHKKGLAHGLAFSVRPTVKTLPPSLVNIRAEAGISKEDVPHGSLIGWSRQGVLLINTVMTVEEGKANSHKDQGWEEFTDGVISALNHHHKGVIFILWGTYAKKKGEHIDRSKHFILEAPHPSGLSAHKGFFGCDHFRKCNSLLRQTGRREIDWNDLPM
jgi:uracil-DNA glycosylase